MADNRNRNRRKSESLNALGTIPRPRAGGKTRARQLKDIIDDIFGRSSKRKEK